MARRSFATALSNNPAKAISADWVNDLAELINLGVAAMPQDYYEATDANYGPAVERAIAGLRSGSTSYSDAFYKGSGRLFIQAGDFDLGSTTLDINHTLIIEGEGTGLDGGIPTRLRWSAGTTGIRVQAHNTFGANGANAGGQQAGTGTIIRGLCLKGAYSGTEAEAHGIHLRARAVIEDCYIYEFQGDGIHANTTAGAGDGFNEGNTNLTQLNRVACHLNRNGFYFNGADANAGCMVGVNAIGNRQWGIWDSSFLGNTWLAPHVSDNGLIQGTTPTVVSYNGKRYALVAGQAVGAATNAPSGTTADNTWWYYNGEGDPSVANNIPAWSNGITVREGGKYYADNANQIYGGFINVYAEGGQGIAQTTTSGALVMGGDVPTGNAIHLAGGSITMKEIAALSLALTGMLDVDGNVTFHDGLRLRHYNANETAYLDRSWSGATVVEDQVGGGSRLLRMPVFMQPDGTNTVADFDTNGMNLAAGKVLKVAGNQVVGARGAAVADAAALTSVDGTAITGGESPTEAEHNALIAEFNKLRTDVEAVRTTLNTLLARERAHGLIAT